MAATYDLETIVLYLNGVALGSCNYSVPVMATGEPLYMGSSYPGGKDFFVGVLDEVRIHNRSLTSCEIEALYNAR